MDFSRLKEIKNSVSGLNPLEKLSAVLPELSFESLENMLADFASAFTQGNRLVKLQIGNGETFERLLPQSVEGTEGLSKRYKYNVICLSPDAFIPLNSLLGQAAQLDIVTGEGGGLIPTDAPEEVTRCGLITQAQMLPSDGGFAKYQITIEPPVALLRHRTTSRVFQDMTVPEIVEKVINEHIHANRAMASSFNQKYDILREHLYTPRSYCLQYRETDLAFIERLLFEEGLSYRFEHTGADAPSVTFIVFDDPFSLPEASQKTVRFHRAEATEKEDSLTDWRQARQIGPGQTTLASFDYKPVLTNETGAECLIEKGEEGLEAESTLEDYEVQTLYYATDSEELDRYASRRQEAHDLAKVSCRAEGNVRQLQAGQWFSLVGHPYYDRFNAQEEREFVVCKAKFIAHNNLPQGLANRLTSLVGATVPGRPQGVGAEARASEDARPYWVEIEVRKRGLPLTPAFAHTDHAKPTAKGLQTATVTGPEGEEVYTDEMGRVKIQFHWQRQKEHAEFGANFDERSSCWVRVAYPVSGGSWGHQSLPRIGQEVLVDFIEGDIDRPIVKGAVHNGRQPNPWFSGSGSLPANRALTGIKTKEHHGQQYGELLFDDTTGQVRTKLSSEHGKTQLNQGFLTHPRQDGKAETRGEGFELRTDHHGALRASEGILISTESKPGASGRQLDREQAISLLESGRKNAQTLGKAAQSQGADVTEIGPETRDEEGTESGQSSSGHLDHLVEAIKAWAAHTNIDPKGESATSQSGKQPVILMSGQEGIGLTTPKEMALIARKNLDTVSLRDTQQTTARRWIHNAGKKISLFVDGIAGKFNLKLITAKGHAKLEAQSGDVEITGDQNVRLIGSEEKVVLAAHEEILLQCAGAYVRLKGGNIDVHCPGNILFKSNGQAFEGPASMNPEHPSFPEANLDELFAITLDQAPGNVNFSWKGMPYKLYANGGVLKEGVMDESGRILVEHNVSVASYKLEMANGQVYDIPVVSEFTNRAEGEAASTGYHKHIAGIALEGERVDLKKTARNVMQTLLEGSKKES